MPCSFNLFKFHFNTFLVSLLFGILLPTVDIGSDVYLLYETLTFVGESIAKGGCRVCYGISQEGIETNVPNPHNENASQCNVCITEGPDDYAGSGCGLYPFALDKLKALQDKKTCVNEKWSKGPGANTTFEKRECQNGDRCCIKSEVNSLQLKMPEIDQRIAWTHCQYFDGCEACVGGDASDMSSCIGLINNDNELWDNQINSKCTDGFYVLKNSTFINGICKFDDKCCVKLRKGERRAHSMCNNNPCIVHINYLSAYSKTINNLKSWKTSSELFQGTMVGGKICSMLYIYGAALSLPLLLNLIFTLMIWWRDVKKNETSLRTLFLLLFYRQLKVIKYLMLYNDVEKMEKERKKFERDVAAIEPFCESVLQVRISINHLLSFPNILRVSIIFKCHLRLRFYKTYLL